MTQLNFVNTIKISIKMTYFLCTAKQRIIAFVRQTMYVFLSDSQHTPFHTSFYYSLSHCQDFFL